MWVNRENPKWRAVYDSLPHDGAWRSTGELFTLAQKTGLVRIGDNMGGLVASMRKHESRGELSSREGIATPAPKPGTVNQPLVFSRAPTIPIFAA